MRPSVPRACSSRLSTSESTFLPARPIASELRALGRREALVGDQQVRVAEQHVERRAEIVAEHRHDLVLLAVERAQAVVGLDQLLVALDVGVLEGLLAAGRGGVHLLALDGVGQGHAHGLEEVELFLGRATCLRRTTRAAISRTSALRGTTQPPSVSTGWRVSRARRKVGATARSMGVRSSSSISAAREVTPPCTCSTATRSQPRPSLMRADTMRSSASIDAPDTESRVSSSISSRRLRTRSSCSTKRRALRLAASWRSSASKDSATPSTSSRCSDARHPSVPSISTGMRRSSGALAQLGQQGGRHPRGRREHHRVGPLLSVAPLERAGADGRLALVAARLQPGDDGVRSAADDEHTSLRRSPRRHSRSAAPAVRTAM